MQIFTYIVHHLIILEQFDNDDLLRCEQESEVMNINLSRKYQDNQTTNTTQGGHDVRSHFQPRFRKGSHC